MRTHLSILAATLLLATAARAEPAPAAAPGAPQDRSGKVVSGLRPAGAQEPIRIEKIEVVQETSWSLLLDVTYVYEGKAPPAELKLFVLPDMPYWTTSSAVVAKGRNVARIRIGLYEKKLEEDKRTSYDTSTLRVSFDHYAPSGFKGSISEEIVPFLKTWKPRG